MAAAWTVLDSAIPSLLLLAINPYLSGSRHRGVPRFPNGINSSSKLEITISSLDSLLQRQTKKPPEKFKMKFFLIFAAIIAVCSGPLSWLVSGLGW